MRKAAIVLLVACAGWVIAAETPAHKVDEKDFSALSARYLKALQSEKIEDCMACWVSVEQMRALMENPPEGVPKPPPEEVEKMVKYMRDRDEIIKERFPKLIANLKKEGADPDKLVYVKSEGVTRKRGPMERTGNVDMTFKTPDGTLVELGVDDGVKLDGKWYFSDKPDDRPIITKKAE